MKSIPNLITSLRILIIPWIPYVFLSLNKNQLALGLVIFAALSDFLDGYLARKLKATSLVGQILDPLADKLFLLTIIYTLFSSGFLPQKFVYIFFLIEAVFILIGGSIWIFDKNLLVKAGPLGKTATVFFFFLSALSFTGLPSSYVIPGYYLVMALKIISFFDYGRQTIENYKNKKISKKSNRG